MNKKLLISIVILLIAIGGIILIPKEDVMKNLHIKLKGDNNITINYNDEYKDIGATAKYKKKDISNDIKTTNNLDNKKVGSYYYKYTITYKKKSKTIKRKIEVVDKKEPKIDINGYEKMSIYVDDEYLDKGAKAYDEYDGDLTDKIEVSGKVDNKKIGEYTITYKAKDSSGNEATAKRTVNVIKKEEVVVTPSQTPQVKSKTTSKGYNIEQRNGVYYINGILVVNKSYPLPSSYNPGGLTSEFSNAFNKMQSDAANYGVSLRIISGFRSYSRQNTLYNNYAARDGRDAADRYSARPGHSEHQTGLAADINSLEQSWGNTKEGKWLNDNCYKYGFIIRYVKGKESITGYIFEPWHIRYVGENTAKALYNNGNWITLEEYLGITSHY